MVWDHGFKVEVAFGGVGCFGHSHGEMPACGYDAYVRLVKTPDPIHVGHDPSVARDIDTVPFAADDEPRLGPHVFTVSVLKNTGGVGGRDQRDFDIAAFNRATHVEPITLNRAFIDEMFNQLVHPRDRSVQFL